LNRISNMKSTVREYAYDTVDAVMVWRSYKQSKIAGKLDVRTHFREALVSRQDSTGRHFENSHFLGHNPDLRQLCDEFPLDNTPLRQTSSVVGLARGTSSVTNLHCDKP
jgi:hypothetical protein